MVMKVRKMVISGVGVGEVGSAGTDWEGACKKVMGLVPARKLWVIHVVIHICPQRITVCDLRVSCPAVKGQRIEEMKGHAFSFVFTGMK